MTRWPIAVRMSHVAWSLVFGSISTLVSAAAPTPTFREIQQLTARARAATEAGDQGLAAARFDSLADWIPSDGRWLEELAAARSGAGDHAGAVAALVRARELGSSPRPVSSIDIARAWMRGGQSDSTLAWVERALADGFEQRARLFDDPDFAALRENAAFRRLAGRPVGPAPPRVEAWRADLDFLVAEMKRLHFVYSKAEFPGALQADIRALREDIPGLTDAAIFARMERLMAGLGDGHSVLYPVSDAGMLARLPITTYFFSDGLFVVQAPDELASHVGSRVEAIGGVPVATLVERLSPWIPRDNAMGLLWTGPMMLGYPAILNAIAAAPDLDRVALTLVAPNSRRETVTLAPVPPAGHMHVPKLGPPRPTGTPGAADIPAPRWLTRVGEHYWFEPLPDLAATYVQFNQVVDRDDESMRDFALRLRRHIDERKPKHLIIDLRHNNGGDSDRLIPFIRTAVHFETTTQGGRTWVLMGRNTFSAAQVLANNLDRLTNAVFVGEPSGSRPNFVGEDTGLRLPWSGYYGSISSRFHQTWNQDERVWIAPDYPVPLSSADYFAGRDPVMEGLTTFIRDER